MKTKFRPVSILILFVYPVSVLANPPLNRTFILHDMKLKAMQNAYEKYRTHQVLTTEILSDMEKELVTPDAKAYFQKTLRQFQGQKLPDANLKPDGKIEFQNGFVMFTFQELTPETIEFQINEHKFSTAPEQFMDNVVMAFSDKASNDDSASAADLHSHFKFQSLFIEEAYGARRSNSFLNICSGRVNNLPGLTACVSIGAIIYTAWLAWVSYYGIKVAMKMRRGAYCLGAKYEYAHICNRRMGGTHHTKLHKQSDEFQSIHEQIKSNGCDGLWTRFKTYFQSNTTCAHLLRIQKCFDEFGSI